MLKYITDKHASLFYLKINYATESFVTMYPDFLLQLILFLRDRCYKKLQLQFTVVKNNIQLVN